MKLNGIEKCQVFKNSVWLVITMTDSTGRTSLSSQVIFLESTQVQSVSV